jgi:putative FmdB family regulatory protein
MPIYVYECKCGFGDEVLQKMGTKELKCSKCGGEMVKQLSTWAFVYNKGYPSFRKLHLGTAPYTGRVNPSDHKGTGGSPSALGVREGQRWKESIE